MNRRLLVPLLVSLLLAAGPPVIGQAQSPSAIPSPSASTEPSTPPIVVPPTGSGADFGALAPVPLLSDTTAYAGPATPHSLDGVLIGPDIVRDLRDPKVRRALENQGFVIVPSDFPLFHMAYEGSTYGGWPVFVTTDVAYHTWHLVFDKVLRDVEQKVLLPKLGELVARMLAAARSQVTELQGTPLADPASRVQQLLQVAAAELGQSGRLGPLARQERQLVDAHAGRSVSPVLGIEIDYSLFTPRGHYTRTPELTRFFVAMSVLGQSAFYLPGALQSNDLRAGQEPLRMAVLAARTLVGDAEGETLWKAIYEPTAFLVGLADDYTPFELAAAVEATVPGGMADPSAFASDDTIAGLAASLTGTRAVQIDAERPSVRLMGTRFVIDSWVLDQLIYPNVGTAADRRLLPSPLDLAAAYGSDFAYRIQKKAGETHYLNYDQQLEQMRQALSGRAPEASAATVYDAWLSAIEPMWLPHGAAFPDFMRTRKWSAKDQQTGFGSYAELKHDTILFTKQPVGELGGAEPPALPRQWVEPDPVPFARLAALADLTRTGLDARGLLPASQRRLLRDLSTMCSMFSRIAANELAGKPISRKDNEQLAYIGGTLEGFYWKTGDQAGDLAPIVDKQAAIVADIARGTAADGNDSVLEIGTGAIDRIFVLVPNDKGKFEVAVGGVYSYYEFTHPASDRLTDEAWRKMLKDGTAPARPTWEKQTFH